MQRADARVVALTCMLTYPCVVSIVQALPFRCGLTFEDTTDHGRLDVVVRLDCDIPPKSYGSNVTIRVSSSHSRLCGQSNGHDFCLVATSHVGVALSEAS